MIEDDYLNEQEASAYLKDQGLNISVSTLNYYRFLKRPPEFVKLAYNIYYNVDELDKLIDEHEKIKLI